MLLKQAQEQDELNKEKQMHRLLSITAHVLMVWILVVSAVGLTWGLAAAFNRYSMKMDCTTHNFNPDATAGQRELCRGQR